MTASIDQIFYQTMIYLITQLRGFHKEFVTNVAC